MDWIQVINEVILWYFIVVGLGYIILLIGSLSDIFNNFREITYGSIRELIKPEYEIPITVIIPAYNEEKNIINTVESVFNSTYKNLFAIVVNDESLDNTLFLLKEKYQLQEIAAMQEEKIATSTVKHYFVSKKNPRLVVIDKMHKGRSDSLNVGLNALKTPFFMTLDADSLVEPKAVETSIYTLLSRPHTIVVGGGVYLLNGCEYKNGRIIKMRLPGNVVAAFQIGEYLRAFLFGRSGWNMASGALAFPGTNSLFEKEPVMEAGGFDINNFSQDVEIILHLHEIFRYKKLPCRLIFTPSSFVWTSVPSTLKSYWKQRVVWQIGSLKSFLMHTKILFNPNYGLTGLLVYPFYLFVEIFGAVVEFTAYSMILITWLLNRLDVMGAVLLFLVSWGLLSFLTVAVIAINFITFNKYTFLKDEIYMVLLSLFEILGFRQFNVLARVYGTIKYFFIRYFKKDKKYGT